MASPSASQCKWEVVVCTNARDEEDHLDEFLCYYFALGVDHIFIYDNESRLPIRKHVARHYGPELCTVIEFPGQAIKMQVLDHWRMCFRSMARWVLCVDIDEFLVLADQPVPREGGGTTTMRPLQKFIAGLEADYAAVRVPQRHDKRLGGVMFKWRMFGFNGFNARDPTKPLTIERFTDCAMTCECHDHVKSLTRCEAITGPMNAHCWQLESHSSYVDATGRPVDHAIYWEKAPADSVTGARAWVNRYFTRSREEFDAKCEGTIGDVSPKIVGLEWYLARARTMTGTSETFLRDNWAPLVRVEKERALARRLVPEGFVPAPLTAEDCKWKEVKDFHLGSPVWTEPDGIPLLTVYVQFSKDWRSHPSRERWREWCSQLMKDHHIHPLLIQHRSSLTVEEMHGPHARLFLSFSDGKSYGQFPAFCAIPNGLRSLWINRSHLDATCAQDLAHSWLSATEPVGCPLKLPLSPLPHPNPLVSYFMATYRSGDKFLRPKRSLENQAYGHWECVVVDDSDDDGYTLGRLKKLTAGDSRFRFYSSHRRTGYIGNTKREAANLTRGSILAELDHDDDFSSEMTGRVVECFLRHPSAGFLATDCIEEFWPSGEPFHYELGYSNGFGAHCKVWVPWQKRWQWQMNCTPLNRRELTHLIGMPNHVRAWRREAYFAAPHRPEMKVADDFDIMRRQFHLGCDWVRLPEPHYIQYKNAGGNNFTMHYNRSIQIGCAMIDKHFASPTAAECLRRGAPSLESFAWIPMFARLPDQHPARHNMMILDRDPSVERFFYVFSGFTAAELKPLTEAEEEPTAEALRVDAMVRSRHYLRRHRVVLLKRNAELQKTLNADLQRYAQQNWRSSDGRRIRLFVVGHFDEEPVQQVAQTLPFAQIQLFNCYDQMPFTVPECLRYAREMCGDYNVPFDHVFGVTEAEFAHSVEGSVDFPGPPLPEEEEEEGEVPPCHQSAKEDKDHDYDELAQWLGKLDSNSDDSSKILATKQEPLEPDFD